MLLRGGEASSARESTRSRASCCSEREALRFTFGGVWGEGAGTEARKEGTSLCFTSYMMGMTVLPYGVFVDEMQEGGNPRQTWPDSLGVGLTPDPPHPLMCGCSPARL